MGNNKFCYEYPHPAVATDCICFARVQGKNYVLLIERGHEPYKGFWAFPGGFMEINETAEECVRRELKEETGLEVGEVHQFHTFTTVERDPRERVISIAFYTEVEGTPIVHGGDDAARARWFALDELPPLAFDHADMLQRAMAAKKCGE